MYSFNLPEEQIAQKPVIPRDSARLLVYSLSDGLIVDTIFRDIGKYLWTDTTIVVNDSRVENCRWIFGNIEIFVLEKNDPRIVRAMVRPGRKFKLGQWLRVNDWLSVETISIDDEGIRTLRLSVNHDDQRLKKFEHIPLPPYIAQDDSLADEYQTVYADPLGSLAAPTAGLHFTNNLLSRLKDSHDLAKVTLHVGLGTFAKLTNENIATGKLHEETYSIGQDAASALNNARHITAVGTTTIRALESSGSKGKFVADLGSTDIFIRPGYQFNSVDSVVTNFHLPSTSLLMLVAAFIADKKDLDEAEAEAELLRIYNHAIDSGYRFYSFGDAMLLV